MLDKLKNIFEAQKKMNEVKKGLEGICIDHEAAGGKIKISMTGTQRVVSFEIDSEFLQPEKKEKLQKELVSCVNGAADKVQRVAAEKLKSTMGDLKIPGF
ncbi:MAG: YbaB/EbfC family nucleoid-associated protein [Candidatus Omnitrophica bacterium]|nr:YbaB/EbfC family nucleoid-associated protein [Candidatus Omnitrophota bacterium]MBU4478165.1 YbaB/EbfC family nucleoid-associated protein [Candidatus Omnitrophota bacterium]MCG2703086.1 YbaB/EbfC family nucleoid-associated protein [Candidatus Omnitrophota bacterium]